jgi:hypothetical protein
MTLPNCHPFRRCFLHGTRHHHLDGTVPFRPTLPRDTVDFTLESLTNEEIKPYAGDDELIPPLFLLNDVETIRALIDGPSFSKLDITGEYPHRVPANSKLDFTVKYNDMTILRKAVASEAEIGVLKLLLDEPSVDRKGIWETVFCSQLLVYLPVTSVTSLLADPPTLDELEMMAETKSAALFRLLADCYHDDTVRAVVSHPEIRIPLDRDQQGCTLIHRLAMSLGAVSGGMRLKALQAVLTRKALVVDARNHNGMTALD